MIGISGRLVTFYFARRVRNPQWTYDADENVLADIDGSFEFDAAGRLVVYSRSTGADINEVTRHYTGDGLEAKRTQRNFREVEPEEWDWEQQPTYYYIRSTVLGGQVVSDVYDTGTKKRTYVRAGGEEIAWQNGDSGGSVVFQAADPAGMSLRSAEPNGDIFDAQGSESSPAELDPLGNNVGQETPFVVTSGGSSCVGCGMLDETMPLWAAGGHPRATLNGFPIDADELSSLVDNGHALPVDLVEHMRNPNFRFVSYGFGMYRALTVVGYRDISPTTLPNGEVPDDEPIRVQTTETRVWGWVTRQTQTPRMNDCEKYLARLFTKRDDTIFSDVTDGEPIDTLTGQNEDPANSLLTPDKRIQQHNHAYNPTSQPSRETEIFAPAGGEIIGSGVTSKANGSQAFVNVFYRQLGGEKNVVLQFFHTFHNRKFSGGKVQTDGTMLVGALGPNGVWSLGYGKGPDGKPIRGFHLHINAWKWWGKIDRAGNPILRGAGKHPEGSNRTLDSIFKLSNLCPK